MHVRAQARPCTSSVHGYVRAVYTTVTPCMAQYTAVYTDVYTGRVLRRVYRQCTCEHNRVLKAVYRQSRRVQVGLHVDGLYTVHGRVRRPTAVYTAVYGSCTRVHDRVHSRVNGPYCRVHGPCTYTEVYSTVNTAVFTARTTVYMGRVHTWLCTRTCTAVYTAVHGPYMDRVHGPYRPCVYTARKQLYTRAVRAVYTTAYTAVCIGRCTVRVVVYICAPAVYKPYTRLYTVNNYETISSRLIVNGNRNKNEIRIYLSI